MNVLIGDSARYTRGTAVDRVRASSGLASEERRNRGQVTQLERKTNKARMEDMHLLANRRATFEKSRKGANKSLNWPHPLKVRNQPSTIHPDALAHAGFLHDPISDSPALGPRAAGGPAR